MANWSSRPSGSRSVNPRTFVSPSESMELTIPTASSPCGASGSRAVPPNTAAATATATTITASAAMKSRNVPRSMVGAGGQPAVAPVPVLPGAWSGVPSAQRGQVAEPGS